MILSPQGWPPDSSPLDPWPPSPFLPPAPRISQPTQLQGAQDPEFYCPRMEGHARTIQTHVLGPNNWSARARERRPSLCPPRPCEGPSVIINPPICAPQVFHLCSFEKLSYPQRCTDHPCSVCCSPTFIKQINCFALVWII